MGVIEFELTVLVHAPIDEVFARLADIEGHNDWMPRRGSILRRTEQTSPGEPGLGTTYVDRTSVGTTPGEIVEFVPPTRIVYHWWDATRSGRVTAEGWPGYTLGAKGVHTTLVIHDARMQTHGLHRVATPAFRRLAVRERTTTLNALAASFRP